MPPILIDTNILVYIFDQNEPERQKRALEILGKLEEFGNGRLSVQCLSEFCSVVMRRLKPPLTPSDTINQVVHFQQIFPVFNLTPMIVLEAVRGVRDYQLSYYDAQIWACARLNQIPIIFSEDFHHGILEGINIINPFAQDFDFPTWFEK